MRITKRGGRKGRGFHQYGPPMRCTYGTTIDVYESSSAVGPRVWLKLNSVHGRDAAGESTAHLNPQEVRRLIDRLRTFLKDRGQHE